MTRFPADAVASNRVQVPPEVGRAPTFQLVVVTAENDRSDEHALLEMFFAHGLERLHVRKPRATRDELARWLERVPPRWRNRLVLHTHHDLAAPFGIGGLHWRDDVERIVNNAPSVFASRSCHDLATLRACGGIFDGVFFGPVFPSISKTGYVPNAARVDAVSNFLGRRTETERSTEVIAIGGVTAESVPRARAFGFDGVAVLGAIWQAEDPVMAFVEIQAAVRRGLDPASSPAKNAVAALPS